MKTFVPFLAWLSAVAAQQAGEYSPEQHPPLPIQHCTKDGCVVESNTGVVMDGVWRWLHKVGGYDPCIQDGKWTCGNATECAQTCAYEGISLADYAGNYGVSTTGDELTMKYSDKFSSRLFLTAGDDQYRVFKMLNQEFAFDVDTSTLDCGMNGAMDFLSMEADGGLQYPNNKAGAKYGLGVCDAQCGGVSFINGEANQNNEGLCCGEFDLWESNKISTSFTSHPSSKAGTYLCTTDCNTITDKNGCGWNPYGNGDKAFYGPGSNFTVDSSRKVMVVTQFVTDDNTSTGTLVDIRRLWVQDGKVIANSRLGASDTNSISDAYCNQALGPTNTHTSKGGLKAMGEELGAGMVLSFSIWTDPTSHMTWLDSGWAGSCPADSGDPAVLMKSGATLKFSNIRVGDIGTTFSGVVAPPTTAVPTSAVPTTAVPTTAVPTTAVPTTAVPTTEVPTTKTPTSTKPPKTTPVPTTTKPVPTAPKWGQCGGIGYAGPTVCAEGYCQKYNDYWSQCV